mmetsp:Transcript_14906/g.20427  ORF Transcript_14906/g.20427 Transcript_14906/m.20427 type:complete len:265 (+) Transcript_14906:1233-2027(+)
MEFVTKLVSGQPSTPQMSVGLLRLSVEEFRKVGGEANEDFVFRMHAGATDGETFQVDTVGRLLTVPPGERGVAEAVLQVQEVMVSQGLSPGNALRISVRGQALLDDAISHLRRALLLRPLHPEAHGLLAELLGLRGNSTAMRSSVQHAVKLFETSLIEGEVSNKAVAGVLHKLATTFLAKEMSEDAIPLLRKTLKISPAFVPALLDSVIAQMMSMKRLRGGVSSTQYEKRKEVVRMALERFREAVSPQHPALGPLQQQIRRLML